MHRFIMTLFVLVLAGSMPTDAADDFGKMVSAFSAERYSLATNLSFRLDIPFPDEADAFFRAATTSHWQSVSNHFQQLMQDVPSGYSMKPSLRNELWSPIHETLGGWEAWIDWKKDSELLAMFYDPILDSMPDGSIYFGGTDPGRFVITTVNALRNPAPVFCITQNALADNTYMAHLRAVYGDRIWIPENEDSARAFTLYVEEVESGKRPKNAEIKAVDGRMQITGVLGVMEINGILCEMIVENNRADHEFYIEESYVIDWMYPYLEPHGLIMKLNPQALDELSAETVAIDRQFWADVEKRLLAHPAFRENFVAEKTFSKLRAAIAGLYVKRELYQEAEYAFEQAIRLCPVSPEANFRLADMYVQNGQITDAIRILEAYVKRKPPYSYKKAIKYLWDLKLKNAQKTIGTDK